MSAAITHHDSTGLIMYAVLEDMNGRLFNGTGFETVSASRWNNYDIALSDTENMGIYQADMPNSASGVTRDIYSVVVYKQLGASPAISDIPVGSIPAFGWDGSDVVDAVNLIDDVYHADLWFNKDDTNSQDEYTVQWFLNGEPLSTGISSPTLQVIKRTDGTDLIAETTMTEIDTIGAYKYDEATNRLTDGEAAIAVMSATINGSVRVWKRPVGRDG